MLRVPVPQRTAVSVSCQELMFLGSEIVSPNNLTAIRKLTFCCFATPVSLHVLIDCGGQEQGKP